MRVIERGVDSLSDRRTPAQTVDVVRQPITLRSHTRRRLEERLALRFPGAAALVARSMLRLPPRARLRRLAIRRTAQLGWESLNRDDVEAALALYHPDIELIVPEEFVGLGLEPVYRGFEQRKSFEQRWIADWGKLRYEFEEVIDLGDGRVLMLGRVRTSGVTSGAAVDREFAEIFTFSAGRVIREQPFLDHADALEAAGLPE
jgi:ketosteroid isomerase-like protein